MSTAQYFTIVEIKVEVEETVHHAAIRPPTCATDKGAYKTLCGGQ